MQIYIELFLLQNTLINLCLLKLIYLTTKTKTSFLRLILASLICALPNLIVLQIINSPIILNTIKITTSITMILIAYKQKFKQFIFNFGLLFLYTYAFLGIALTFSSSTYLTPYGAVISNNFKLETICLVFIIFTYFLEYIVKHIKFKINANSLIYNITLKHQSNILKTTAYLDTGNFLNHNGKPILILDLNTYLKFMHTNLLTFLTNKTETIRCATINGSGSMHIFKIDKLIIYKSQHKEEINDALIAVDTNNCFKNTNYNALLSPLFM